MISIIYTLDLFIHQSHRISWLVTRISHNHWLGNRLVLLSPTKGVCLLRTTTYQIIFFLKHHDSSILGHNVLFYTTRRLASLKHIRWQRRQELCLYLSSQTYGSNTAHYRRECSQPQAYCLFGNLLIYFKIKYLLPYFLASYLCLSKFNSLILVSHKSPFFKKILKDLHGQLHMHVNCLNIIFYRPLTSLFRDVCQTQVHRMARLGHPCTILVVI